MLHFVTSYMNQNKKRKETLNSVQYRLEIIFNPQVKCMELNPIVTNSCLTKSPLY